MNILKKPSQKRELRTVQHPVKKFKPEARARTAKQTGRKRPLVPNASIIGSLRTYAKLDDEKDEERTELYIDPDRVTAPFFFNLTPLLVHVERESLSEEVLEDCVGFPEQLQPRPNADRFFAVWEEKELPRLERQPEKRCHCPEVIMRRLPQRLRCTHYGEPSLLRGMFLTWRREILLLALPRLAIACLSVLQPLCLGEMLRAAEEARIKSITPWALLLFALQVIIVCMNQQQATMSYNVSAQVRGGLASVLLAKGMQLDPCARQSLGIGNLVNVLSVDIVRIGTSCEEFHELWQTPLMLLLALIVLFWKMGPLAIAAMVVMAMFGPFNLWVVKKTHKAAMGTFKARDARVRMLANLLHCIKVVKMLHWEGHLGEAMQKLRADELLHLRTLKKITVINNCIDWTAPVLLPMLLFGGAILTGHEVTASAAFMSLSILDTIQGPMNRLPRMLTSLVDLLVGVDRVKQVLLAEELEIDTDNTEPFDGAPKPALPDLAKEAEALGEAEAERGIPSVPSRRVSAASIASSTSAGGMSRRHSLSSIASGGRSRRNSLASTTSNGRFFQGQPLIDEPAVQLLPDTRLVWWDAGAKKPGGRCPTPKNEDAGKDALAGPGEPKWSLHIEGLLAAPQGAMVHVAGGVGAGKSTLLQALLGEVNLLGGGVTLRGHRVTYCQQDPWIRAASFRENVLFGLEYVEEHFNAVVEACGLAPDLAGLAQGDLTPVGERGVTLSGGQRARLALARACYPSPDIIILDDVLSAVDAKVARHLVERCLCGPNAFLADTTRIMAVPAGGLQGLLPSPDLVWELVDCAAKEHRPEPLEPTQDIQVEVDEASETEEAPEAQEGEKESEEPAVEEGSGSQEKPSTVEVEVKTQKGEEDSTPKPAKGQESSGSSANDVYKKEEREQGAVKLKIWRSYLNLVGVRYLLFAIPLYAGSQGTVMGSNFMLAAWTDAVAKDPDGGDVGMGLAFLARYSGLLCASAAIVVIRNCLFAYFGSLRASRRIHDRAMPAILAAPMSFFWDNPAGRIMTRFSSDLATVDLAVMPPMQGLFKWTYDLLFGVGAVLFVTPPLTLLLLPSLALYRWINNRHRTTARELNRLLAVMRGGFAVHFDEMLNGAAHVRAWRAEDRLRSLGEELRVPLLKLGWLLTQAELWKSVRLQLIASCLMLAVALFARLTADDGHGHHKGGGSSIPFLPTVSAGMLGVMLRYTLQVTNDFGIWIHLFTETEVNLVGVERLAAYCDIKSELQDGTTWQLDSAPALRFSQVKLSYRKPDGGIVQALRGVSFFLAPGKSLGVCGRTGAGKSSVVAALFRLVELEAGQILLNDQSIATVSLRDLRRRIGSIPQESLLFAGDLRFNLDPAGEVAAGDDAIWAVLDTLGLAPLVRDRGGLAMKVEPGGVNLSAGERQLLATARALLRNPALLVLDEATANVDEMAEQQLMSAVQKKVAGSVTTLSIAHRVRTLLPLDQVMVLSDGQVQEFGEPLRLMQEPGSTFRELVEAATAEAAG